MHRHRTMLRAVLVLAVLSLLLSMASSAQASASASPASSAMSPDHSRLSDKVVDIQGLVVDGLHGPWTPSGIALDANNSAHIVTEARGREGAGIYYIEVAGKRVLKLERLSQEGSLVRYPDIALHSDALHVVWQEGRGGNTQIYYRRRVEAGWGPAKHVSESISGASTPQFVLGDYGELKIEWTEELDEGVRRISRCTWLDDACREIQSEARPIQPVQALSSVKAAQARRVGFLLDGDVWSVEEDGSNLTRLTHSGYVTSFAWSPNGQDIAYIAYDANMVGDVYVMRSDGSEVRRLTHAIQASRWVVDWHGSRVVFIHGTDPGMMPTVRIAYVDLSGPSETVVELSPEIENWGMGFGLASWPQIRWSPDGRWAALGHGTANGVVSADGATFYGVDLNEPTWKHDSSHVIHTRYEVDGISFFDPNTASQGLLSSSYGHSASYSPDDVYVAYATDYSLRRMNADGTGHTTLIYRRADDPDWTLDGSRIVYASWAQGDPFPYHTGIHTIAMDGSGPVELVPGEAHHPRWQPSGYAEPLQFTPLYPYNASIASTIMGSGEGHRYYVLRDAHGTLVSGASIVLSPHGSGTSDSYGIADLVFDADTVGGGQTLPAEANLTVTDVTIADTSFDVVSCPTFTVWVEDRPFAHSWKGGTVRKAKGGVSTGLIAYLEGEIKGGLGWDLEETDSSVDADDRLTIQEQFQAELGGGVGLGAELELKGGISSAGAGASAETELRGLSLAEWQSYFDNPYTEPAKKAQAAFVLSGLMDLAAGAPGQPLLAATLSRLMPSSDYASYTEYIAAGVGAEWKPACVHAGAEINLVGMRSALLGLEALDAETMLRLFGTLTDYQADGQWGLSLEQETGFDVAALAVETPLKEKIGAYVGGNTTKLREELFFEKETLDPVRLELSFTGEGNSTTFSDITVKDATYTFVVEGDDLQIALDRVRNLTALMVAWQETEGEGLVVGESAALSEVKAYLSSIPLSRYEVSAGTEAGLTLIPEIGFTAIVEVDLGAGVEFGEGRRIIVERGYATPTGHFPTEVYPDRQHGAVAGKSIWDLLGNAAEGAWLAVGDLFNSIWQRVEQGVGWSVHIPSRTGEGVVQAGARLFGGNDIQLSGRVVQDLKPMAATQAITITATSWVPTTPASTQIAAIASVANGSSGDAFAVGGVYQFSPADLTFSPSATLVLTYTDQAAAGIDESHVGMLRWNPQENNWQPMTAVADTTHNTFTGTVSQLGTFTLGYDETPPQVQIWYPKDGSTMDSALPLVTAHVVDQETGIDPATVEMALNDEIVAADYFTTTGQVTWLSPAPLSNGQYTVTVSAADVIGNSDSASATFTVDVRYDVYLPLMLRDG